MESQASILDEEPVWKERYVQSLNDLEEKQQDFAKTEDRLYKSILRLLFSYTGIDDKLDDRLATMRGQLQKEKDRVARNRIIDPIIEEIVSFSREKGNRAEARENSAQADPLAHLLESVSLPGEAGIEVLALRKRAAQINEEQERLQLIQELVQILTSSAGESTVAGDESGLAEMRTRLMELFEWLSIPKEYSTRVEHVKTRISKLESAEDLSAALRDTAIVVNDLQEALQAELGDIQNFLVKVTARLVDVEDCFQEIEGEGSRASEDASSLNALVEENVRCIRDGILDSDDVMEMKRVIETRLTCIEQSVSAFQDTSQQRQQKWQARVSRLMEKVDAMKGETEQLRRRIHEEYRKAKTDALTAVPNRLAYNEKARQEFARWQRNGQAFCLCVIDVDKFKGVNDSWGHKAGDKVLKTIAEVCASNIRKTDFFARYGGEEFILLLPETQLEQARVAAENLRREVELRKFHYSRQPVPITISCGIAEIRKGESLGAVFERADKAMYRAKQGGRNRVMIQD